MTQVRASAQALIQFAKKSGAAIILVGHVTKDGQIGAPVVEHMVDAVLSFEGEGSQQFRILRAVKNRFGPTDEIGVFEMTGLGLREVSNPSETVPVGTRFGHARHGGVGGIEGTRPVPVELQALVARPARRGARWWAGIRAGWRWCWLEAHCGVKLSGYDVSAAGHLQIQEPAAKCAAACPGFILGERTVTDGCGLRFARSRLRRGPAGGADLRPVEPRQHMAAPVLPDHQKSRRRCRLALKAPSAA